MFGRGAIELISLDVHIRFDVSGDVLSFATVRFDRAVAGVRLMPCGEGRTTSWWLGLVVNDHARCARFVMRDLVTHKSANMRIGLAAPCP